MIVRVLRANVKASKVAAFDALLRSQVELMRELPGLRYVKLARRILSDGSEEVVLFEEWKDSASLYQWVGPNLADARLVPGARPLITTLDVAHYEALDLMVGEEPPGPVSGSQRPPPGVGGPSQSPNAS